MSAGHPQVSVIMPVYNAGRFLRKAIESILRQTFRDYEFLIVDDGSTDDSVDIVRSCDDPRIRLIPLRDNCGASAARNTALTDARGTFVAVMDADDVSHPARLGTQLAFLRTNATVGLVGTWIDMIDSEDRLLRRVEYPLSHETLFDLLGRTFCFCHPSIMMRTTVLQECGGYRPFPVTGDHDLVARIAERHRVANVPDVLLSYRIRSDSVCRADLWRRAVLVSLVTYLCAQRRAGKGDRLQGMTVSEQREWIAAHGSLVRKQAKGRYRRDLALAMHDALVPDGQRRALKLALKGAVSFPGDRLFWRFVYYHGAPRAIRRAVHALAHPQQAAAAIFKRVRG